MKYLDPMLVWPICITLHFSTLKGICQLSDQVHNVDKSCCSILLSSAFVTELHSFVLSANFSIALIRSQSKSFMKIRKSIGPSTDPWGTPLNTGYHVEKTPSRHTLCFRFCNQASIHFATLCLIPCASNFFISLM